MVTNVDTSKIDRTLRSLRDSGVVPAVAAHLIADRRVFVEQLQRTIETEVDAYQHSGNPDIVPQLGEHLNAHASEICRLLAGERTDALSFVVAHAQRCAEQKFPLDAVLQAVGCLHKALSHWIRDAALHCADDTAHVRQVVADVMDFTIEYCGATSTAMTAEYVAHTRMLAETESDQRSALLFHLLSGYDESDTTARRLLRRGGYLEQRQSYCVAVARSVDPREMENTARATRMADAVGLAVRNLPIRCLMGIRDNLVTVVLSARQRQSGWTAPQQLLADRVYPALRTIGTAALIGLSGDVPSTSHIPDALREAKLSLDYASVGDRVVRYTAIPLQQMLIRLAGEKLPTSRPDWLLRFLAANKKGRGALGRTLTAYADADMNVLQAAKALGVHPNTMYSRFNKIESVCGKSALRYRSLSELLLALECYSDT